MSQHATSKALCVGNQVVLYFCTGRGPIGEAKGCVYLFKDAIIVMTRKTSTIVPKRVEIDIQ
eukprot:11508605-Karenia_brevis.AAC.1